MYKTSVTARPHEQPASNYMQNLGPERVRGWALGFGERIWGVWGVWGLGFGVWGLRFGIGGLGFGVLGLSVRT